MHRVFDALTRLLAPILVYTADEAWEFSHVSSSSSIHIETFPTADPALRDESLEAEIESWLKLRAVVAQSVEPARQQKLIGNALEATVTLEIADATQLTSLLIRKEELEEFIILSDLTLHSGLETKSSLTRTAHKKCSRCWRFRPTVGLNIAHPDLCDRCASVTGGA
jgi:isoleucyl-tRNA synthetase